jgi:hypothetical protein
MSSEPESPKRGTRPDQDKTADGFHRTRLRYGKGLRGHFLIKLSDEPGAESEALEGEEREDGRAKHRL